MKFHSSTSIGGVLPVPVRSVRHEKVDFSACPSPPTLDDIYEAVKSRTLMGSKTVVDLFESVVAARDGTVRSPQSDLSSHVEQFNFGMLSTETIAEAEREGHEFIRHGLFQLPYPICLYRVKLKYAHDPDPIGVTLMVVDADYKVAGLTHPDGVKGFACVSFTHDRRHMTAMHSINTLQWEMQEDKVAVKITIAREEADYWQSTAQASDGTFITLRELAEGSQLAVGLTMILNTKHIRKERVAPPEKPNKARLKQGRPLIPWTTRVYTAVYNRAVQPGEGTHASPRPHRRRAHVRHYPATAYREAYVRPIAAMLVNWDGKPLERGQYEVHGDD